MCPRDVHVCTCIIHPQENPYLCKEHLTARACLVHCVCRFASIKIPAVVHLHQSLLDRLDLPNICMYVSSAASDNSPQRRDPGPSVPSPKYRPFFGGHTLCGPSAVSILPLTVDDSPQGIYSSPSVAFPGMNPCWGEMLHAIQPLEICSLSFLQPRTASPGGGHIITGR